MAGGCVAHKVHLVVSGVTRENDLIGNVHALEFIFRIKSRQDQILRALKELVFEELELLPGPPDPAVMQLNRLAVEHTLLRFEEQVRARAFEERTVAD